MVVCGCFFENVKLFNGIEVGAFILDVQNFACILVYCQMCAAVLLRVGHILKIGVCIGKLSCFLYIWF